MLFFFLVKKSTTQKIKKDYCILINDRLKNKLGLICNHTLPISIAEQKCVPISRVGHNFHHIIEIDFMFQHVPLFCDVFCWGHHLTHGSA